jgi:hypothetical protein
MSDENSAVPPFSGDEHEPRSGREGAEGVGAREGRSAPRLRAGVPLSVLVWIDEAAEEAERAG